MYGQWTLCLINAVAEVLSVVNIVDDCNRVVLAIGVDLFLPSSRVIR